MSLLALSFLTLLLVFLGIGVASVFYSRPTPQDYLVTGKSTPAWLAGLSAVATNNSGYMFVGMIGLTYQTGLSSIWLMIGWIIGDFVSSLTAGPAIRQAALHHRVDSYGDLLSHGQEGGWKQLRQLVGLLSVAFLTLYAAAQLTAGAKATAIMLHWPLAVGALIGAIIVLVYSAAGGLRASIWTDAAQSFVMLFGMAALVIAGLDHVGGMSDAYQGLVAVDATYLDPLPQGGILFALLAFVGWFFGGFVVLGQPHIVIRLVSMDPAASLWRMRGIYYFWFTLFYAATIAVGLLARLVTPPSAGFDPETALPVIAMELLPEWGAGCVLAALFAATLSTADSLVLACSAAVTRDITPNARHSLRLAKGATATVVIVALAIALGGDRSVFALVLDAWGLLGVAFVPLLILSVRGVSLSAKRAFVMIATGVASFLFWNHLGYGSIVYGAAVGVVAGILVGLPWSKLIFQRT